MKKSFCFYPVSSRYGAPMGRQNQMPDPDDAPVKLRLCRARWVDGDYDQGGAYWGGGGHGDIYCGYSVRLGIRIYARGKSEGEAAAKILDCCPTGSTCGTRYLPFPGAPHAPRPDVEEMQRQMCAAFSGHLDKSKD
jgi:hypothetical protein